MDFPAVTVCNLNQFRKSKLTEVKSIELSLEHYTNRRKNKSSNPEFEAALEKLRKILITDLSSDNPGEDINDVDVGEGVLIEHLISLTASMSNVTQLEDVGHQFNDTILSCSWKGVDCLTG